MTTADERPTKAAAGQRPLRDLLITWLGGSTAAEVADLKHSRDHNRRLVLEARHKKRDAAKAATALAKKIEDREMRWACCDSWRWAAGELRNGCRLGDGSSDLVSYCPWCGDEKAPE